MRGAGRNSPIKPAWVFIRNPVPAAASAESPPNAISKGEKCQDSISQSANNITAAGA